MNTSTAMDIGEGPVVLQRVQNHHDDSLHHNNVMDTTTLMGIRSDCLTAVETSDDHHDNSSTCSEGSSDNELDSFDLWCGFCDDEESVMNERLTKEIEEARQFFGEGAVMQASFAELDLVYVKLSVDTSSLQEKLANAWKFSREEPLIVRVSLSLSRYLDGSVPEVEVYQDVHQEKFGIAKMVQRITQTFVSNNWALWETADVSDGNQQNVLIQIVDYVRQRLPTLNKHCVICDQTHIFDTLQMVKPSVCNRELCVFTFQTMGYMSGAAVDLASDTKVIDLLITLAQAACVSTRRDLVFDPFPTVVSPLAPKQFGFHPRTKNFEKLKKNLSHLTKFCQMATVHRDDIKERLDALDVLAYPLLLWVISSNRSHIVKLSEPQLLQFMCTPHQFLLMASGPSHEEVFQQAKREHGTVFAFHGSRMENWHSILRQGLINASGTKMQLHGSVHGRGIYLSPLLSLASEYSKMGKGLFDLKAKPQTRGSTSSSTQRGVHTATPSDGRGSLSESFANDGKLTCIALCEVINSPELKKHNNIWVCPKSTHVSTRFLFVYENGCVGGFNVNTAVKSIHEEIFKAIRQ